jgi:hypothetical protein
MGLHSSFTLPDVGQWSICRSIGKPYCWAKQLICIRG